MLMMIGCWEGVVLLRWFFGVLGVWFGVARLEAGECDGQEPGAVDGVVVALCAGGRGGRGLGGLDGWVSEWFASDLLGSTRVACSRGLDPFAWVAGAGVSQRVLIKIQRVIVAGIRLGVG